MSQENLKKFYEEMKANKAFADELNAFVKAEKAETAEQIKAAMVKFASQKAFAFTAEEFDAFAKENQALSEADLDAVSGGIKYANDCNSLTAHKYWKEKKARELRKKHGE